MKYEKMKRYRIGFAAVFLCVLLAVCASGCAPKAAEEPSDDSESALSAPEAVAADFAWAPDADCSICHSVESSSMTDKTTAAEVHGARGDVCATCHTDEEALAAAHEGAATDSKLPKKLKKTRIDEAVCLSCHEGKEYLAEKTASSSALTDSEGTTVNPHALPSNSDHDVFACSDCHKMHDQNPVGDTAKKKCLSCHHQDVFECGTCHDA